MRRFWSDTMTTSSQHDVSVTAWSNQSCRSVLLHRVSTFSSVASRLGQSAIIQSFCQKCRTVAISSINQTSYRVSLVLISPSGQHDVSGFRSGALVYAVSIRSGVCLGSIIPSRRKMHVDSVRRHGVNSGMTIRATTPDSVRCSHASVTRTAIKRVPLR